jgi:phage terminase large subunit
MVETFEAHPEWFTDKELLREMLRFVYNEDHRPEAMAGEHDDLVMGTAIAYAIRWQQASEEQGVKKKEKRPAWTSDMWEDYRNAGEEMRELMRQEWGAPEQARQKGEQT